MSHLPTGDLFTAIGAMRRGLPLERPLTREERILAALLDVPPTHMLTLHSKDLDRDGMQRSWSAFRKRIERKIGKPPIYVAVTAKSATGGGGQHLHALLWTGYLHAESLHGFARGTGLGAPDIQMLPKEPENQIGRAQMIGYVLGQLGPVFGSHDHQRHEERARSQRRYSTSTRRVLEAQNPQLLAALDRARDRSLPDDRLCSAAPRFSRDRSPDLLVTELVPGDLGDVPFLGRIDRRATEGC